MGTIAYLQEFTTPRLMAMSNEEIVCDYQKAAHRSDTPYIATLFIRLNPFISALSRKYPFLDSDVCDTAAMEAINLVLHTYEADKKTKVSTRFYSIYKRTLYREFRPYMYKKRNYRVTVESLDDEDESLQSYYMSIPDKRQWTGSVESNVALYEMCPDDCVAVLTYIMRGYNAREISTILNIPYSTTRYKIRKLKDVFPKSFLTSSEY